MEAQPTFFRLEFGDTFSLSLSFHASFQWGREKASRSNSVAICLYGGKRDTARHTNLLLVGSSSTLPSSRRLPTQLCFESFLLFDTWRQPEGVNNIWDSDKKKKERGNGSCMGLHAGSVKDSREGRHLGENECIRSTSLTLGYGAKKGMLLPGISFHLFHSL